jgi:hypothetical protein
MDADYDPVAGFARAAQTMAETQQILAQTNLRIEETQRLALRTIRGLAWLQGVACGMLGLALLGIGLLVWHSFDLRAEHAVQTQALLELVRRGTGH